MAAKFDGKRARENMWVTHQNLARAKGGRPLYQPKAHKGARPAPIATTKPTADTKKPQSEPES